MAEPIDDGASPDVIKQANQASMDNNASPAPIMNQSTNHPDQASDSVIHQAYQAQTLQGKVESWAEKTTKDTRAALDYIGKGFGETSDKIDGAAVWNKVFTGELTPDEARNLTAPNAMQTARNQDINAYEAAHKHSFEHAVKEMVGAIPYLTRTVSDAIPLTLAGTATGAGAGALTGAEAGVLTGPFAEVGIPSGVAAGAVLYGAQGMNLGFRAGIGISSGKIAAGMALERYVGEGMPLEDAKKAAWLIGGIGGIYGAYSAGRGVGVTTSQIGSAWKQGVGADTAIKVLGSLAKELTVQVGLAEINYSAGRIVDSFIGNVGTHQVPTWKTFWDGFADTAFGTAATAIPALGIAHTLGSGIGKATAPKQKSTGEPSTALVTIADAIHQTMAGESKVNYLFRLKAELKVMKAEEKHTKAVADLTQARRDSVPVKSFNLGVEIAKEELRIAKAEVPALPETKSTYTLAGKVTDITAASTKSPEDRILAADHAISHTREVIADASPGDDITGLKLALQEALTEKKRAEREKEYADIKTLKGQLAVEVKRSNVLLDKGEKLTHKVERAGSELDPEKEKQLKKELKIVADELSDVTANANSLRKEISNREKHARNDAIKRLEKSTENAMGKDLERDDITKEMLTNIADFVKNQDKVPTALQEYDNAYAANVDTFDLQLKRDTAATVGDLSKKSAKDIHALADLVDHATTVGLKGRLQELVKIHEESTARIEAVLYGIQGNKPISVHPNPPKGLTPSMVLDTKGSGGNLFFGWKGKWQLAMRDVRSDAELHGLLKDLDVRTIVRTVTFNKMHENAKLFGYLEAETDKTKIEIQELLRKGHHIKLDIPFLDEHENVGTMELTVPQVMKALLTAEDPELLPALVEGNGLSENIAQELRDDLSTINPDYVKLTAGYKKYYQDAYYHLAAEYYKDTGNLLPQNPHYPGYTSRIKHAANPPVNMFELHLKEQTLRPPNATVGKPKFTKARSNPDSAIGFKDIHADAIEYIARAEQYKGWWEVSRYKYAPVLRNPLIRRAMTRKYGHDLIKAIDEHFEYLIHGRVKEEVAWAKFLNKFLGSVAFAKLTTKPLMVPKHVLSVITGAQYVPVGPYIAGIVKFYRHPVRNWQMITNKSIQFKIRYAAPKDTFSGTAIPEDIKHPVHEAAEQLLMSPITIGSKLGTVPLLYSAYLYELDRTKNEQYAIDFAEMVAENTQTSGSPDITSNLSKQPGGNYITMFHEQVIKFSEANTLAWQRQILHPSPEHFTFALKASIMGAIGVGIFPLIDAIYKYLREGKKEGEEALWKTEMETLWALCPGSTYPVLSDSIHGVSTKAHNIFSGDHYHFIEPSTIPLDIAKSGGNLMVHLLKDLHDRKWGPEQWMQTALDTQNSIGAIVGSPFGPPLGELNIETRKNKKSHNEILPTKNDKSVFGRNEILPTKTK